MRFSDIQDEPLDYDIHLLIEKLEKYFTVYPRDYKFINYLKTNNISIMTTNETITPIELLVHIKTDPILGAGFKQIYVSKQQLIDLYEATVQNKETGFSKDFLQEIMCGTTTNKPFQNQLRHTIANIALEEISGCTASELNDMFSEYFEDSLDNFSINPKLYFSYKFTSNRSIKIKIPTDEFELVKSNLTDRWMLIDELPEHLIDKFKEDCTEIKNLILNQPTELELVLNKSLPEELIPYLNKITHINITMNANKYGQKWIIDNDYIEIEHDDLYYDIRNYKLELNVPIKLEYDNKNLTIAVFPIKQGRSIKPIDKAIDMLQNYSYYWNSIKEQLKTLYIKDLCEQAMITKRDIIRQLIFSSNDKTICFKDDNIEYTLMIQQDKAIYYCNHNKQIIFIKKENDFEISLEYSGLLHTKISDLIKTIYELIDKF
ncbi:MAG: hypothetical protein D8H99_68370 [Streptococcus sp.]|nr:MAG: hypothetical protein D8H99_68370 [Streptococcus sp.]